MAPQFTLSTTGQIVKQICILRIYYVIYSMQIYRAESLKLREKFLSTPRLVASVHKNRHRTQSPFDTFEAIDAPTCTLTCLIPSGFPIYVLHVFACITGLVQSKCSTRLILLGLIRDLAIKYRGHKVSPVQRSSSEQYPSS